MLEKTNEELIKKFDQRRYEYLQEIGKAKQNSYIEQGDLEQEYLTKKQRHMLVNFIFFVRDKQERLNSFFGAKFDKLFDKIDSEQNKK